MLDYRKIGTIRSLAGFREYLADLGTGIPCDDAVLSGDESPLARPISLFGRTVGNRWAVQPMEGWDGTADGRPSENTFRRWRRFGSSGAKLIWGGEAVAVLPEARANPNQLWLHADSARGITALREALVEAHAARFGRTDDLVIGLQLTHSGRFCRPYR